jgi:hypothetical protein
MRSSVGKLPELRSRISRDRGKRSLRQTKPSGNRPRHSALPYSSPVDAVRGTAESESAHKEKDMIKLRGKVVEIGYRVDSRHPVPLPGTKAAWILIEAPAGGHASVSVPEACRTGKELEITIVVPE